MDIRFVIGAGALITALTTGCSSMMQTPEHKVLNQEAREIVKEFGYELKGTMQKAFKQAGPTAVIEVCQASSDWIATKVDRRNGGWEVGRTSLKLRNPDNAPVSWEMMVLQSIEARKANGEDPKLLSYSEVVTEGGIESYRFMMAIPTAEKPCIICHGDAIDGEITALLDKHYPNDKARGFKAGDIRGAFTLQKRLN